LGLFVINVQGDSGGKVSVLGGDNIGHYEKTRSYEDVCNYECSPR